MDGKPQIPNSSSEIPTRLHKKNPDEHPSTRDRLTKSRQSRYDTGMLRFLRYRYQGTIAHSIIGGTWLNWRNFQWAKALSATPAPDLQHAPFLHLRHAPPSGPERMELLKYASLYWEIHAKLDSRLHEVAYSEFI